VQQNKIQKMRVQNSAKQKNTIDPDAVE